MEQRSKKKNNKQLQNTNVKHDESNTKGRDAAAATADIKKPLKEEKNLPTKSLADVLKNDVGIINNNNTNTVLKISEEPENNRKFSKRKLINNWDKYKEEGADDGPDKVDKKNTAAIINRRDDDNEQLNAADFQKLLDAPQSVGTHFVFNSEKHWDEYLTNPKLDTIITNNVKEKVQPQQQQQHYQDQQKQRQIKQQNSSQKFFNLNLSLLTDGILSIPFYKRHNYPIDRFTTDEIENMNRCANEIKFSRKIPTNIIIPTNKIIKQPSRTPIEETKKNVVDPILVSKSNEIIHSIEILNKQNSDQQSEIKNVIIQPIERADNQEQQQKPQKSYENIIQDKIKKVAVEDAELDRLIGLTEYNNKNHQLGISTAVDKKLTNIIMAAKSNKTIENPIVPVQSSAGVSDTKNDMQKWLDDLIID